MGHIKKFRACLASPNQSLTHMINDIKIASAIVNCFFQRPKTNEDEDIAMARKMKLKMNDLNLVED